MKIGNIIKKIVAAAIPTALILSSVSCELKPSSLTYRRDGFFVDTEELDAALAEEINDGLLIARAWNDNDNYDDWLKLFERGNDEEPSNAVGNLLGVSTNANRGKMYSYVNDSWGLDSFNRLIVKANDGGSPVGGLSVKAYGKYGTLKFSAVTNASGEAYLFPQLDEGYFTVEGDIEEDGALKKHIFSETKREFSVEVEQLGERDELVQVMFLVDATLSMQEEISFLRKNLTNVINGMTNDGSVPVEVSLLFYRDDGDADKFVVVDFVDSTDEEGYASLEAVLNEQSAYGGGDYPEAMDEALEIAIEQSWQDNATKIIFHLYDAPPREKDANKVCFNKATLAACEKGIRICPVLADGSDTLCEYLARQSAIVTGGIYSFLADETEKERFFNDVMLDKSVSERFDHLILRIVEGYRTGSFAEPKSIYDVRSNA